MGNKATLWFNEFLPPFLIPELAHNLAAQLSHCPQLANWVTRLWTNSDIKQIVSLSNFKYYKLICIFYLFLAPCMSNCIDILARDVVAFHFCQLDDEPTCLIPEFVHNLAAQLSRCPQLASFRSLLESNPELMGLVTYSHCLENPSRAFVKGILEPLALLRSQGKVSGQRWIFGHFPRF